MEMVLKRHREFCLLQAKDPASEASISIFPKSKKAHKKEGFGNHSEASINLNLKLNYENSYFTLSI